MMPILYEIKKQRLKELQEESKFVKGLIDDLKRTNNKLENVEQKVWDMVEWWKTKNKWKRAISENDEKAWRMIKKKLNLS